MYARVVTNQIKPDLAIVRDSIVPALKDLNGFKGFVAMTDHKAGKSIGYSMWETEADLAASEASGNYLEQIAKLSAVLAAPPAREVYELTFLA